MTIDKNTHRTDKEEPVTFLVSGEAETRITVNGPGEFAIKIEANPGTGYSWSLQKPLAESTLKFKSIEIEEREEGEPPKLGAPTYEILRFEALEPGEAVIHLKYSRPWEKNITPIKSHKIVVTVN